MSPIWKFNDKGEATRVFETKNDLRARNADLAESFVAERHTNARLRKQMEMDQAAWRDLMASYQAQAREISLLTLAESYRTKERDILLAGGTIETDLRDIQDPLAIPLAQAQESATACLAERKELVDDIMNLGSRIAWVMQQHAAIGENGRCTKCNVGAPCRTIRVLLGDEDPS